MFGLFSKKQPAYIIRDIIWKSSAKKIQALTKELSAHATKTIIITYFPDTQRDVEQALQMSGIAYSPEINSPENVVVASAAVLSRSSRNPVGYRILFAEHHPSFKKEEALLQRITDGGTNIPVTFYVAMDEPLMQLFGSDRIMSVMEKMGFQEDESIEHTMISTSIQRAQQKIDEQQAFPLEASSAASWLQLNNIRF